MADKDCVGVVGPYFGDKPDTDGNCVDARSTGRQGPNYVKDTSCKPWQLTNSGDSAIIDAFANEALSIAGANFNVYMYMGVHEQAKLVDATGKGNAISGGAQAGYPAANAFTIFQDSWHSIQTGQSATIASAFIGYDFGAIKTSDGLRDRYGIDTACRKNISAFIIKQSSIASQRVTTARLERSEDGFKWYGVHIVKLPDDDCLNMVLSRASVDSRYWRLRPIEFNGGATDRWVVSAFQMFDNYDPTFHDNVQDKILLENRERDYNQEPITLKGSYDLLDVTSELTKFGIELPSQTIYATFNFAATVAQLGRPLVVGDIIEMPSEIQYNANMKPIKKWMEVTDISWSTEGYTPGWTPTLIRAVLQPAHASQETQDIFGDLAENFDEMGLADKNGHHPIFQDYLNPTHQVMADYKEMVPERGTESSSVIKNYHDAEEADGVVVSDNLKKLGQNPKGFQTEDAMPPNNAPFTEGDEFPLKAKNGEYHRLTYDKINDDIGARLYRYSATKNRWIFLEVDRRALNNSAIPIIQEFLTSPNRVPHTQITKKNC